jgi:NitT/TauT family transport system permease protein
MTSSGAKRGASPRAAGEATIQAVLKVALAPLIIIWFGFGIGGKVAVTSVITFFPLLVNTIIGYRSVDRDRIDFACSRNASDLQIL